MHWAAAPNTRYHGRACHAHYVHYVHYVPPGALHAHLPLHTRSSSDLAQRSRASATRRTTSAALRSPSRGSRPTRSPRISAPRWPTCASARCMRVPSCWRHSPMLWAPGTSCPSCLAVLRTRDARLNRPGPNGRRGCGARPGRSRRFRGVPNNRRMRVGLVAGTLLLLLAASASRPVSGLAPPAQSGSAVVQLQPVPPAAKARTWPVDAPKMKRARKIPQKPRTKQRQNSTRRVS